MDTNADVNLLAYLFLGVVSAELGMNALGTLHGMDHRREVHQEGIADGFDDMAVMLSDGLLDQLVVGVQQAQRTSFVAAHLAAEAHDVGEHDGNQATSLGRRWPAAVSHRSDYAAYFPWLSNGVRRLEA